MLHVLGDLLFLNSIFIQGKENLMIDLTDPTLLLIRHIC